MPELTDEYNQRLAEFSAKKAEERRMQTVSGHEKFSSEHTGPTPTESHDSISVRLRQWWDETGSKEKYADTGEPVYRQGAELRTRTQKTKKGPFSSEEMLVIEVPASYAPDSERDFAQRFTYNGDGRLVRREIGMNYDVYEWGYSKDGYLVKMTDRHCGEYGSETQIDWGGQRVTKMTTQFFSGAGNLQRGQNDGQAIITTFPATGK